MDALIHANGSVNSVIFRKLQRHVLFGPALPLLGTYPAGELVRVQVAHAPATHCQQVWRQPWGPCREPVPPRPACALGDILRGKGALPVWSGSRPGAAQPTCSLVCRSQDPLCAEKCEGGAGPRRLGGPREGVIYSRLPVGKHRTVSSASAGGERCLARPCLLSCPPASS